MLQTRVTACPATDNDLSIRYHVRLVSCPADRGPHQHQGAAWLRQLNCPSHFLYAWLLVVLTSVFKAAQSVLQAWSGLSMTSSADIPAAEVADGQVPVPEAAQAALHLDQEQAMQIADKVRPLSGGQPPRLCACNEGCSPLAVGRLLSLRLPLIPMLHQHLLGSVSWSNCQMGCPGVLPAL